MELALDISPPPRSSDEWSRASLISGDRGAVTIVFAVLASVMMGAMCVSIDTIDAERVQARTQMALDVASLAAAADLAHFNATPSGSNLTQWQADAQGYLQANLPGSNNEVSLPYTAGVATVTGTPGGGQTVNMSVSGTMKLYAPLFLSPAPVSTGNGSPPPPSSPNPVTVSASNSALRVPQSTLELVMVLDNTGSMNDSADGTSNGASKMAGLQAAANSLVQDLLAQSGEQNGGQNGTQNGPGYYVGLVPFASTVNVLGALSPNASWMNPSFAYNPTNVQMEADEENPGWGGCVVEPRDGSGYLYPLAYSPSDTRKFTPYFYNVPPAGLQIREYKQSFCSNGNTYKAASVPVSLHIYGEPNLCGYAPAQQGTGIGIFYDQLKNNGVDNRGQDQTLTQNSDCIGQPVTFLTGNQSTLQKAINKMTAGGSTIIPTGLLWGWRMLSSSWSNNVANGNGWISNDPSLPKPETMQALQRVMIVLTDGENQIGAAGTIPNDLYFNGLSGVGNRSLAAPTVARTDGTSLLNGLTDSSELHGGNPSDPSSGNNAGWPDDVNTFQASVCNAIKQSGVTVYAITFGSGASNSVAQQAMQNCASPGNYYHAPDNATLSAIFQQIAGNLGELRLVK